MGQLRDQLKALPPVRRALLVALVALATNVAAGVAPAHGGGAADAERCATEPARVTGGASTLDELVARFLAALRAGDRDALEELRLTRDEYVHLVMPGHVPPGEPPQRLNPEAAAYFFAVLDAKSRYSREALVARFAGRALELRGVGFEKGVADYAGHRAYRRTVLRLADESGHELDLRTGSVVERDGRFKFASYTRD